MSLKFLRGLGWNKPLPSLQSKFCVTVLMVLNEVDNYFATAAYTMIDIVHVYDLDKD